MKISLLKNYFVAICICSTLLVSAQDPGDGSTRGPGLEGPDPPPPGEAVDPVEMPIDNHLLILASVGISIAFLRFRAIDKQQKETI